MPSIIREYFHCGNTTTNRAEGFFGNLKKGYFQGAIKNLEYTFKAVHNMSEQMLRKSLSITNPIIPIELINEKDARLIARMACGILLLEYSKFLDIWRKKIHYQQKFAFNVMHIVFINYLVLICFYIIIIMGNPL